MGIAAAKKRSSAWPSVLVHISKVPCRGTTLSWELAGVGVAASCCRPKSDLKPDAWGAHAKRGVRTAHASLPSPIAPNNL